MGTEQILLGLIGEGTGNAAKTLKSMGVTLQDARVEVEEISGRGKGEFSVEIPFTPDAKRLLEASWAQAKQLDHNYIETGHLLLGILTNDEISDCAKKVLDKLGADPEKIKSLIQHELAKSQGKGSNAGPLSLSDSIRAEVKEIREGNPRQKASETKNLIGLIETALEHIREAKNTCLKEQIFEIAAKLREDETALLSKIEEVKRAHMANGAESEGQYSEESLHSKFNEKAIKVIMLAQLEARRLGHNFVGTEQILLGLIEEGTGTAATALKAMGVNLEETRVEVCPSGRSCG